MSDVIISLLNFFFLTIIISFVLLKSMIFFPYHILKIMSTQKTGSNVCVPQKKKKKIKKGNPISKYIITIRVARVTQHLLWRPSGCVARAQADRPVFKVRTREIYPHGCLGNNDQDTLVYRKSS